MNWEPTWILFGCVLLNAIAGLLLFAIDGVRTPSASEPADANEELKRWRGGAVSGGNLPLPATPCRVTRGQTLNRSVG